MTTPPELLAEVTIDGHVIRVEQITDGDGNHALQLDGVNCRLTGEMPGPYYPEPLSAEWSDESNANSPAARRARGLEPIRPVARELTTAEITEEIRSQAARACAAADSQDDSERYSSGMITPLADALCLAADLIDRQERFIVDLRNHKADAPTHA